MLTLHAPALPGTKSPRVVGLKDSSCHPRELDIKLALAHKNLRAGSSRASYSFSGLGLG